MKLNEPAITRRAVIEWLEWLKRTREEEKLVAGRAAARKRIIAAIASEN